MAKPKKVRPSADRILEAAEEVITRDGYGETSLRNLMQAAGVSTTAFYARFASKEEVLRALVARLLGELATRAQAELTKATGLEDGFRRGVDVLFDVLSPRRKLVRVILTEAASSPAILDTLGKLYESLATLLRGQITSLSRGKGIKPAEADAIAWGVVGALNMQILRWAVYEHIGTKELRTTLHASAEPFLPMFQSMAGPKKKRKLAVAS